MKEQPILSVEKQFAVRFSEVDMMSVVWHGAYPLYLEDAREAFGEVYGLSYHRYIDEMIFAPIVDMSLNYKRPLRFGMKPTIKVTYRPTESAKIIFDYEIYDPKTGTIFLTASTTQVFMDRNYNLMWYSPEFYTEWKKAVGLL
jgi:acyl-CoA thioester hydrolase